jgi:class 3 adenylate cyclase/tetratricopeptide (TPR) repeat protein
VNDTPIRVIETPAAENLEGERKTVTALFADIKGSMDLIEALDPEEARAIVDPALKLMMDAAHRYGGYVAQSTGDGILALFGAPVAHEDHPQRALYAALRMQNEMQRYSGKLRETGHPPVEARVGVNTGEVVMRSLPTGEGGRTEYVPVGHSISLAARMEVLAPVGSIATTQEVRSLCEGYFLFKSLGPTRVKGVSDPVNVYEVTGQGPLRTHFQLSTHRGLTRFVGRGAEMEAIARGAELAKAGHGQLVCVVAEPGVGKSRLLYEFKIRNQSGWMVLEAFSVPHGKASAYLPVIDLLQSYFRIAPEDDTRTRREKVNGKVLTLDRKLEDALPYLLGLLGLTEGDDPLARMDARIRRQRTLEALKRVLFRESVSQPLMVVFEDLHWIDEETQAFLNLLADSMGTANLLLLVSYRPDYSQQWSSKTSYTQLRLDPLGKELAGEMFDTLLGVNAQTIDAPLLALRRLIVEETEGTPLFMEEIYQALMEEGALTRNGVVKLTRPLNALKIPTTVQAILASRIDRLPATEKELLQTLAVIGMAFPLPLARQVISKPDDELDRLLSDLQLAEFIYEQPTVGDIAYTFKHALTRQVAYNSMLGDRRKSLHERVATAIEELYSGHIDDWTDVLAHHYGRTANTAKTVEYLFLSGQRAAQRSAFGEGVASLNQALDLLHNVPEDRQLLRLELRIQTSLFDSWRNVRSVRSPEIRFTMERAVQLSEQLGDRGELFGSLLRLSFSWLFSEEFPKAHQLAQRSLDLAEELRHPSALSYAHMQLGQVLQRQGELLAAEDHYDKGVSFAEADSELGGLGAPAFPDLLGSMAQNLWLLGHPDRALALAKQVMSLARSQRDEWDSWAGRWFALVVLLWRQDSQTLDEANQLLTLATERGLLFGLGLSRMTVGSALVDTGRLTEGVAQIERGQQENVRVGMHRVSKLELFAASALGKVGRGADGLQLVENALRRNAQTGEKEHEAEFHRLLGELLLTEKGNNDEADRAFRTAIDVAHRQSAKSWELRATTSLARLLTKQGKRDEARAMLADIYNWFTEGFDTADLKDAKALLDELTSQHDGPRK